MLACNSKSVILLRHFVGYFTKMHIFPTYAYSNKRNSGYFTTSTLMSVFLKNNMKHPPVKPSIRWQNCHFRSTPFAKPTNNMTKHTGGTEQFLFNLEIRLVVSGAMARSPLFKCYRSVRVNSNKLIYL